MIMMMMMMMMTSGYATMVHGRGCNPHRSMTTFAKPEITSFMTSQFGFKMEIAKNGLREF